MKVTLVHLFKTFHGSATGHEALLDLSDDLRMTKDGWTYSSRHLTNSLHD